MEYLKKQLLPWDGMGLSHPIQNPRFYCEIQNVQLWMLLRAFCLILFSVLSYLRQNERKEQTSQNNMKLLHKTEKQMPSAYINVVIVQCCDDSLFLIANKVKGNVRYIYFALSKQIEIIVTALIFCCQILSYSSLPVSN